MPDWGATSATGAPDRGSRALADDERVGRDEQHVEGIEVTVDWSRPSGRSQTENEHSVNVDYLDRLALVALVDEELAAVVRYDRTP